jgi:putative ATP-binding cassette transporter
VEPSLVSTYMLIIFFMLSPLQNIGGAVQGLSQANVALEGVRQLSTEISADLNSEAAVGAVASGKPPDMISLAEPASRCQSIEIRDVTYEYHSEERMRFGIGPVNLLLRRGQTLFVVGGNGSGKTTFLKLLCGLYEPTSGAIYMDGELVDAAHARLYRQQFAGVFADNCLFDGLSDSPYDEYLSTQSGLIRYLRLEHAARTGTSLLAQANSFSAGERKRMGLLLACACATPVVVFDEFAADQDPEAKRFFYHEVLAQLKAEGKIVVVVTHDDRYFNIADQLVVLERGVPPVIHEPRKFTHPTLKTAL